MAEAPIQFDTWYIENPTVGLAYSFIAPERRTIAIIRGKVDQICALVDALNEVYFNKPFPSTAYDRKCRADFRARVLAVIATGRSDRDNQLPCFKNDRVRLIRRPIDDDSCTTPGGAPYSSEADYVEMRCDEQYGGEYPTDFPDISSRASFIRNVCLALDLLRKNVEAAPLPITEVPACGDDEEETPLVVSQSMPTEGLSSSENQPSVIRQWFNVIGRNLARLVGGGSR